MLEQDKNQGAFRKGAVAAAIGALSLVSLSGVWAVSSPTSDVIAMTGPVDRSATDITRAVPQITEEERQVAYGRAGVELSRSGTQNGILSAFQDRSTVSRSSARSDLATVFANESAIVRRASLKKTYDEVSTSAAGANAAHREESIKVDMARVKAEQHRIAAERKAAVAKLKAIKDARARAAVAKAKAEAMAAEAAKARAKAEAVRDAKKKMVAAKAAKRIAVEADKARVEADKAAAVAGRDSTGTKSKVIGSVPVAAGAGGVTPLKAGTYSVGAHWGEYGSWSRWHTGQDFPSPIGTPVYAVTDGVASGSCAGCQGWAGDSVIVIHHANGGSTLYAHVADNLTTPGQVVKAGQLIGHVGMKGRTFGPHLHFEYYPAGATPGDVYSTQNPLTFLLSLGAHV